MSDFVNQVNDNGTIYDIHDKRLAQDGDTAKLTGNLSVAGTISGNMPVLTTAGDEISAQKPVVEVMTGYSYVKTTSPNITLNTAYVGICKNGNKLSVSMIFDATRTGTSESLLNLGRLYFPADIMAKIIPVKSDWVAMISLYLASDYGAGVNKPVLIFKETADYLRINLYGADSLVQDTAYYGRLELTFLLSDNLAA